LAFWATQAQEGLKGERLLRNLLLLCNPDAALSVWATPPKVDNTASPSEIVCTTRLGGAAEFILAPGRLRRIKRSTNPVS
jgi:hypothetical protein